MNFLVALVEFVLSGVKQDPGRSGINLSIGVTISVGRLSKTVGRHD